jgi:hypothetical protein
MHACERLQESDGQSDTVHHRGQGPHRRLSYPQSGDFRCKHTKTRNESRTVVAVRPAETAIYRPLFFGAEFSLGDVSSEIALVKGSDTSPSAFHVSQMRYTRGRTLERGPPLRLGQETLRDLVRVTRRPRDRRCLADLRPHGQVTFNARASLPRVHRECRNESSLCTAVDGCGLWSSRIGREVREGGCPCVPLRRSQRRSAPAGG